MKANTAHQNYEQAPVPPIINTHYPLKIASKNSSPNQKKQTIMAKETSEKKPASTLHYSNKLRALKLQEEISKHIPTTGIIKRITPALNVFSAVKVTPAMAKDLLTLNSHNRPLTVPQIDKYADLMNHKEWKFAGNTIKFNKEIKMDDGQHTLFAMIQSNTTQVLNIQTGLEPEAFSTMDIGRVRSAGDILAIMGFKDYNTLAAAVKVIIYFTKIHRISTNIRYNKITNTEVVEWVKDEINAGLIDKALSFAKHLKQDSGGSFMASSTWAVVYYLLSRINQKQAKEFCSLLASGENIDRKVNHPAIWHCRETLIKFNEKHYQLVSHGGTVLTDLKIRYIIRAWNSERNGEEITSLKINTKEAEIEKPI